MKKKHFSLLIVFISTLLNCFILTPTRAQFTIIENFHGSSVGSNIKVGGSAYLTSGIDDPVGEGWLRLTKDLGFQKGYAYIDSSFPSTLGVLIDFEYKTWRASLTDVGGDGFTVFLFDATVPFLEGGYGGSLGYAPFTGVSDGLAGGYIGIGFDEFGNFSNPTQGRIGGPGQMCNSIVLRGPTTNDPATTNIYLTGVQLQTDPLSNINSIDYNTPTYDRPSDDLFYRRVKISIEPIGTIQNPNYKITVKWRTTPTGNDITLLTYNTITPPPPNLKVGFAASTGGSVNCHEIRDLVITTPGGMRVDKTVDKLNAKVGDQLTYKIDVYNSTNYSVNHVNLTDTIKDANNKVIDIDSGIFTINSITFNNNGNAANTAEGFTSGIPVTSGLTNPFRINELSFQPNTMSTFIVKVTLKEIPPGGIFKNTVVVNVDPLLTGITDEDLTNNTFTVSTNVLNTDFELRSSIDNSCSDSENGNTITLKVFNIGTTSSIKDSTVTLRDTIPMGAIVTNVSGEGWSITHSNDIYTFSRKDALSPGSSYPPVILTLKLPVSGTIWINSAKVDYTGIEATEDNNFSRDTIYVIPQVPEVVSLVTYCQGETALPLIAMGSNLLWYTDPIGSGSPNAPIPQTSNPGSTIYYVSQTSGKCESPLSSIEVIVYPQTEAPQVVSPVTYCRGETASPLTAIGTNLLWYTDPTGSGSPNAPTPQTSNPGSTTYYVSQTSGKCESLLSSIEVIVYPQTEAPQVVSPVTYCRGETASPLTAIGTNLLWYTDPTGSGSPNAPTPQTSNPGSTTYYVSQTSGKCESPLSSIEVIVYPPIHASIIGDTTLCKYGSPSRIYFRGYDGIPPYTFTYKVNNGPAQTITTIIGDTISIPIESTELDNLTYSLINVSDERGCWQQQTKTVTVNIILCNISIIIPNAFTPNGDGYNDVFLPETENILTLDLKIIDRNGRLIYSIDSVGGFWDGNMSSGEAAPDGTYFYKMKAYGRDNKIYTQQGSISLFRNMIDKTPLDINLIPNPVKGELSIKVANLSPNDLKNVTIYTLDGKLINTISSNDETVTLNLSELPKGLYLLKVSSEHNVGFCKFIKQ